MKKVSKIFLLSFIVIIFIFSFANVVFGDSVDIACSKYDYPWCKDKPTGIADLVGKFYGYALAAVGVAALGAIIYGGILHTVSAGSASQQTEARAWIWGAVTGVALLLGAYLLLNTINPELVKLKEPGELIKKVKIEKGAGSNMGYGLEGAECFSSKDCASALGLKCDLKLQLCVKSNPISPKSGAEKEGLKVNLGPEELEMLKQIPKQ